MKNKTKGSPWVSNFAGTQKSAPDVLCSSTCTASSSLISLSIRYINTAAALLPDVSYNTRWHDFTLRYTPFVFALDPILWIFCLGFRVYFSVCVLHFTCLVALMPHWFCLHHRLCETAASPPPSIPQEPQPGPLLVSQRASSPLEPPSVCPSGSVFGPWVKKGFFKQLFALKMNF